VKNPKKKKSKMDSNESGSDGDFEPAQLDPESDDHSSNNDSEDEDYAAPSKSKKSPSKGKKPKCMYGTSCYRTNPQHLAEFSHPKQNNNNK